MPTHAAQFFSARRAFQEAGLLAREARGNTTSALWHTARSLSERLKKIPGLQVSILELPADGMTAFGGWIMPQAWDVTAATLHLLDARRGTSERLLCDYRTDPLGLLKWSPPTPPGGIQGDLVLVPDAAKFTVSLKGKFALVSGLPPSCANVIERLVRAGAAGLISDAGISSPGGWANPHWVDGARLPAFALAPETGRLLRARLARKERVLLHACVDARLYAGTCPMVSACLEGASGQHILLAAPLDGPGDAGNTSGIALGAEVLRACAERARPLRHGVYFLSSLDGWGMQAYLNLHKHRGALAGINLRLSETLQRGSRTSMQLRIASQAPASLLAAALPAMLDAESRRAPKFRVVAERTPIAAGCHLASAPLGVPMVSLEQSNAPGQFARLGRLIARCAVQLADAGPRELRRSMRQCFQAARLRLKKDLALSLAAETAQLRQICEELAAQFPEIPPSPMPSEIAAFRTAGLLDRNNLSPHAAFREECARAFSSLHAWAASRADVSPALPVLPARVPPLLLRRAQACVPEKTFPGYLAYADLRTPALQKAAEKLGVPRGSSTPPEHQAILDACNGKRSLADIHALFPQQPLAHLLALADFWKQSGSVRFRPALTPKMLLAALRKAGIRSGDLLVAHTSLSEFGYFEGGAKAVLDTLLKAVGPKGTLCIPTHSLNWLGAPPYDPRRSPSLVGAITNVFLKYPGVRRSLHPTHSVAVHGPLGEQLIAGHDHTVAPQSPGGFWGKFFRAGGKVLMLCRLQSNTLLHCGETIAGTPFPSSPVHFMENGKRRETLMTGMTWHTDGFRAVYAALRERGLLREVKLGAGTLAVHPARDAVEIMVEIVRQNPRNPLKKDCACRWCKHVGEALAARNQ